MFRRRGRAPADDLTLCATCGSEFVSPMEWAERPADSWWMRLRCGQCGEAREVVVPHETARRYDRALDRASEAIAATASRLDRERMAAQVEAFATALQRELIDAADFAERTVTCGRLLVRARGPHG
jgi:DNA-directed RNA polymerase subunit RPC12/RpoP